MIKFMLIILLFIMVGLTIMAAAAIIVDSSMAIILKLFVGIGTIHIVEMAVVASIACFKEED